MPAYDFPPLVDLEADEPRRAVVTRDAAEERAFLDHVRRGVIGVGTRIRTRLNTEVASREELLELLTHALSKAGNAALMTPELMDTLVDHCAGNYRLLMTMGSELLAQGITHEVDQLDERLYLEVFRPKTPRSASKKKVRV